MAHIIKNTIPSLETAVPTYEYPAQAYARYLQLPKQFDSVHPDELLTVANRLQAPHTRSTEHWLAAADALYEAAVTMRHPDLIDDNLQRIDEAAEISRVAGLSLTSQLEQYPYEAGTFARLLRFEIKQCFVDMYRDLVCGDVTTYTLEQTYCQLRERLNELLEASAQPITPDFQSHIDGVVPELVTIMTMLRGNMYSATDDGSVFEVTLPANLRCDNGTYQPQDTHDVVHLWLGPNTEILNAAYLEVKNSHAPSTLRQLHHRYGNSEVIGVTSGLLQIKNPDDRKHTIQALRHNIGEPTHIDDIRARIISKHHAKQQSLRSRHIAAQAIQAA